MSLLRRQLRNDSGGASSARAREREPVRSSTIAVNSSGDGGVASQTAAVASPAPPMRMIGVAGSRHAGTAASANARNASTGAAGVSGAIGSNPSTEASAAKKASGGLQSTMRKATTGVPLYGSTRA